MRSNLLVCLLLLAIVPLFGQKKQKKSEKKEEKTLLEKTSMAGLKFRSVGPALTSGRISDFAVNPDKPKEYFIATSSSGVWKTDNAGTTFKPIFDGQKSYSIGCITMDPNHHHVLWVGTGENNNQRSVAYGDGVYKSTDAGKSWKNMGLKSSEHIGKILVDPRNSDVVYVAAIGPLWSEGGERGVYKTTDGGKNWTSVLTIDEHTGVTDMVMDPRNPDIIYAAAYQRRRHVFTYLGGGPGSGIYKTTDGGENWEKVNKGLPGGDKGRIGLAISPADPSVLYAIVEAAQGKGGFYRSTTAGASWEKRSGYSTSGNYYQEIIADPVDPDKVYAMNTYMQYTVDGGKTFKSVGERNKHVDNHCLWINPKDTEHMLAGCDGGIYETFDAAKTWHYKPNLPITQFYKVAVDNAEPFYNIYGGTQDNFSLGGPSRTISVNGPSNADWFVTHGGDGFESQIDPQNPNIVYAQSQYGVLVRFDRQSGEEVGIKPKARKDEAAYRWNWDAPLAVSAHKAGRIYFAANKLFRSDDRGNSWEVISPDLTKALNRNELEVMGRVWGIDAVAKNRSTSPYGTIVAFSESPLNEDLLYVGTDDGLIQISQDGGQNWQKVESFPGVPEQTYVNALFASQHDENVVYAAFNHHKYGDFKPYVFKSTDRGQSWTSISANLPERGSAYSIAEDHVDPNLIFVGTEFGVFFTADKGANWKQLKAGLPTIAVRDIAIQQRESDLVLGTFGRGFYVLDDYSPLRNLDEAVLEQEAKLFTPRVALAYEQSSPLGGSKGAYQGSSYYVADNLAPVAMIHYYLKEGIKTKAALRREAEKKNKKDGKSIAYPSYEELKAEREEEKPQLLFTIKDGQGTVVRKLMTSPKTGLQRINWDLRFASKNPVSLSGSRRGGSGSMVAPGTYSVSLAKIVNGEVQQLADPVSIVVKPLNNATLPAPDREELVAFQRKVSELSRVVRGTQNAIRDVKNQLKLMKEAVKLVELPYEEIYPDIKKISDKIAGMELKLNYDQVATTLDMDLPPTISSRINSIRYEQSSSTSQPTQTHKDSYEIAMEEFKPILSELKTLIQVDLKKVNDKLEEAGAPYTPQRIPDFVDF